MIVIDRESKLPIKILFQQTMILNEEPTFFLDWIILYPKPSYILIESRTEFWGKSFNLFCTHLGNKNLALSAYHFQKIEKLKQFCETIPTEFYRYQSKHHSD